MSDAKPYTLEEFDAESAKSLFSDFDSVYPHVLDRLRATVEALERAEAERDEARADAARLREALVLSREQHEVCGHDDECDYCREAREVADDALASTKGDE